MVAGMGRLMQSPHIDIRVSRIVPVSLILYNCCKALKAPGFWLQNRGREALPIRSAKCH